MTRPTRRLAMLAAGAALAAPARARAAWTPARPVTLVVGFPPGGLTDLAARAVQPGLAAALGVPVAVENRGGAAGNLGTEAVMGARPDGHTLLVAGVQPMAVNPNTVEGLSFDPREMVALGLVLQSPLVLCVPPDARPRNLAGLRGWLATQPPGAVRYGSSGPGSLSHLAMALLAERLGVAGLVHAPARGPGAALAELQAGRVNLLFQGAATVLPALRGQRLRGLLVTTPARSPALPGIATAREEGLADFGFAAWTGLFAPRGTPPAAVAALNAALDAALAEPGLRMRLQERGEEPGGGPPGRMAALMAEDHARWQRVARDHAIRA